MLPSSSWLHCRDVHFVLQPPVCHRNPATACACHPSLSEHLLPATCEKRACKSHPALEKPQGASNWSPSRCKPSSPLGEPGSPELPSRPPARDEPSRDRPPGTAEKLGQAGATGKANSASTALRTVPVRRKLPRGANGHMAQVWPAGPRLKEKLWVVSRDRLDISWAQCACSCRSPLLLL